MLIIIIIRLYLYLCYVFNYQNIYDIIFQKKIKLNLDKMQKNIKNEKKFFFYL